MDAKTAQINAARLAAFSDELQRIKLAAAKEAAFGQVAAGLRGASRRIGQKSVVGHSAGRVAKPKPTQTPFQKATEQGKSLRAALGQKPLPKPVVG